MPTKQKVLLTNLGKNDDGQEVIVPEDESASIALLNLQASLTTLQQHHPVVATATATINRGENSFATASRTRPPPPLAQPLASTKKPRTSVGGCQCKRNKCIQLYCSCFSNGSVCGEDCKCVGCENNAEEESSPTTMDQPISSDVSASDGDRKLPARQYRGAVRTKGEITGCKCSKTKCLKLYCPCFEKRIVCHDGCVCVECKNTTEESGPDGERTKIIEEILSRRPGAFDKRGSDTNDSGCICKKTRCLKKYCICFSAGIKCDNNKCSCTDCLNGGGDPDVEATASNDITTFDESFVEQVAAVAAVAEPTMETNNNNNFAELIQMRYIGADVDVAEPPLMIEDPVPFDSPSFSMLDDDVPVCFAEV